MSQPSASRRPSRYRSLMDFGRGSLEPASSEAPVGDARSAISSASFAGLSDKNPDTFLECAAISAKSASLIPIILRAKPYSTSSGLSLWCETVGSSVQSVTATPARKSFEKALAPASPASPSERLEARDRDTTIESELRAKRYCSGACAARTAQRLAPSAPSKYAQAKGSAVLAAHRRPTAGRAAACRQAFNAFRRAHMWYSWYAYGGLAVVVQSFGSRSRSGPSSSAVPTELASSKPLTT
mmetsp:Transcript_23196/g.42215  ORF Transcript_23196/g.42215 Transcript_23196/m.42215 type:complete len:241 (+) Transcript_23196:89-811(+)